MEHEKYLQTLENFVQHALQGGDIDRELFNALVYTPMSEALEKKEKNKVNDNLNKKINSFLLEIPEPMQNDHRAVLFRHVTTPQYEIKRFHDIAIGFGLQPLFWEYHEDKFTSNNKTKHALGRLHVNKGRGADKRTIVKKYTIFDFNKYNGKKISEIYTDKGERLIDFHHKLLDKVISNASNLAFDSSDWLKKHGDDASLYYSKFLSLFLSHAILFENFMLDESEKDFTVGIFLPAFLEAVRFFGEKPIIIALNPTEIEGEDFWYCYSPLLEDMIK
ncbi:MAG: hypothetical protein K9M36_03030 [Candidatus Pacebacteria bacterium]|nr:hypothetical protein [Candidatus Paceibacterota bacterium]